jgi:magnesium transporter
MLSTGKKRSKKAGLVPGSLVHIGNQYAEKSKISLIRFDELSIVEKEIVGAADLSAEQNQPGLTWINIDGLHDVQLIAEIGNIFSVHPLIMEDILNTDQRPKTEDFVEYIYIVLKTFHNHSDENLNPEQVSIILGHNFVLSFQEKESSLFEPIRERLRNNKGRIRKSGADYLAHDIIDNIVDNYFIVLENLEEKIEKLEDDLVKQTTPARPETIHRLKRELIFLRKSLWPLREAISSLQRLDSKLINESSVVYFKDISDHIIAIIDTVDTYRDMLAGMLDIYLSSTSVKLNEVMKVLTIIATIFMPLTFLAGVYGMNFRYMPELEWHWGYYGIWAVMLIIAILMLIFFRNKKWL